MHHQYDPKVFMISLSCTYDSLSHIQEILVPAFLLAEIANIYFGIMPA